MSSSDISGVHCPECGYEFELTTGVEHDETPHGGDVSVCVNCGAVSVFTISAAMVLGVRKPDKEELTAIYKQFPEILDIQRDTHLALRMILEAKE